MRVKIHAAFGAIALMAITTFWVFTVLSEAFGTVQTIAFVKQAVLWGMLILVPSMIGVGLTGNILGKKWRHKLVSAKQKRIKIMAANGLLILLPSAVILAVWAQAGRFDTWFYTVQVFEMCAGALNITLLAKNMRDGLNIRKKRKAR